MIRFSNYNVPNENGKGCYTIWKDGVTVGFLSYTRWKTWQYRLTEPWRGAKISKEMGYFKDAKKMAVYWLGQIDKDKERFAQ